MSESYKLTYFNMRGTAESIRFLFAYGGIDYEDERITFENWKQMKYETPFCKVPVLTVDEKQYHQSIAISRYLGKKLEICGNDELEDLEIDAIVDTINDYSHKLVQHMLERDEEAKEAIKQEILEDINPFYLGRLDAIASDNGGYLACGRLTWADFYFVPMMDMINMITDFDIILKYPNLVILRENVINLPAIKEWLETRPETDR